MEIADEGEIVEEKEYRKIKENSNIVDGKKYCQIQRTLYRNLRL